MEYIKSLNKSIDYLEENICEELEVEEIAKIACLSKFHFQRMFNILAGYTIAEYIRKRRLTLAAQELASDNSKVIDVAIKYGYSTAESFSKAFSRLHGINPSAVKSTNSKLKAY
ncbi:MAG: helix-turn-helix domain-containing protein, partial [Halanaerobium sp.]